MSKNTAREIRTHPKVLLVGLPEADAVSSLRSVGINAATGTFGTRYRRQGRGVLLHTFRLPNYEEQEIVVVDLTPTGIVEENQLKTSLLEQGIDSSGAVVDPAPLIMRRLQDVANRILNYGGVFVVFGFPLTEEEYLSAHTSEQASNWDFLNLQGRFRLGIQQDHGTEILCQGSGPVSKVLARHLKNGAIFNCTFSVPDYKNPEILAVSKYGEPVAMLLHDKGRRGAAILLPHVKDKLSCIRDLIDEAIPQIAPYLYTSQAVVSWTTQDLYELTDVLVLKAEVDEIERQADRARAEVNARIDAVRREQGHLHEILTETDAPLVRAVRKTLHSIGFTSVTDVDEARTPDRTFLAEDLRIEDRSPMLLVEVVTERSNAATEERLKSGHAVGTLSIS